MMADLDFYKDAVALAKKLDLIILSDLAYSEIYFDDNPPPSVLQVPGAIDITVEFTSLSKTYNMPGWRMGFAVGNERLIGALARVKSYLDYGAFTPIQVAAAAALNGPQDCVEEIRKTYKSRRDCLVESFGRAGFPVPPPPATMFAWCPIPEPFRAIGSVEFAKLLIEKADVAVSPGLGFGEYGEGFVRIALVENEHRIRQAARSIKKFLAQAPETLHNVIPIPQKVSRLALSNPMSEPLTLGVAGLGTVGTGLIQLLASTCAAPREDARASDRGHGRLGALARQGARRLGISGARAGSTIRWRWPTDPVDRGVRRADGRRRRAGQGAGRSRARGRASTSSPPTRRCSPSMGSRSPSLPKSNGVAPQLRGGGRGRHPDHQDAARGAGGQRGAARLRHPQRHLQLHPHRR